MSDRATNYTRIPNEVLRDEALSWQAKLLYCVGASFVNGDGKTIHPSYKTLAKLCGFSRSTAIRAAKELEERGHWAIEPRRDEQMRCASNQFVYRTLPSVTGTPPSVSEQLPSVTGELPLVAQGHPKKTHIEQDPEKKVVRAERAASLDVSRSAKPPKPKPDPTPHQQLMAAYQEALGYPIRSGAQEGKAGKALLAEGYTVPEVMACFHWLKAQPFWAEKHLSLVSVHKQIGAWKASKQGGQRPQSDTSSRPAEPAPVERWQMPQADVTAVRRMILSCAKAKDDAGVRVQEEWRREQLRRHGWPEAEIEREIAGDWAYVNKRLHAKPWEFLQTLKGAAPPPATAPSPKAQTGPLS